LLTKECSAYFILPGFINSNLIKSVKEDVIMKKKIIIEGMSCNHCVAHVEQALMEVDGVKSVKVDLKGKNAVVDLSHDVDDSKLKAAIEDAGYEVIRIE